MEKHNYRIRSWRHDVPRETLKETSFEGTTVEDCDKQAIALMNELSEKKENSWDGLDVIRIDAPAVAEKITLLADNGRQKGDGDWQL